MNGYPRFGTKKFGAYLENFRPLMRCPFCGDGNASVEIDVEESPAEKRYVAYVECWECGATGASTTLLCPGTAAESAATAWNMRDDRMHDAP